jgi:hypothetical protein
MPWDVADALGWDVEDMIITVRNPADVDASRADKNQFPANYWMFYRLLWECTRRGVEPLFIEFPRFAMDKPYAYEVLSDACDWSLQHFSDAWDKVMDVKKITWIPNEDYKRGNND